ncbi:uncharacterized protein LOC129566323 isoform X2 [Sitodiplosis mosellana]|uniref:uncharacterized protein LOC129566323 isoform X2 n=1 Tax=Sitodiplosis mosellana TaxID=263140 RepID=UPI002444D700|nr:uncharacterized protein LOC129566323 isoform X2 [Sitodiplosis mosellana]
MARLISIIYHMLILYLHGCWSSRPPIAPNKLYGIKINCTRDVFNIKLDLDKSFKGIVFAKDFLEECRTKGNRSTAVEINLPTSGCGIRSEAQTDGSLEMSVRLVIQMDEKLRQRSDLERMVRCNLPNQMMEMNIGMTEEKRVIRHGRMHVSPSSSSDMESSVPRIRVWLELGGTDGSGTVEVGQMTTINIRAVLPGTVGVRIVDCAALDGLGESSQKLLDERGCPIDEQVMPALITRVRPAEEGWSKPHIDDLVEKLFTATFPAFKFPDRERLHVTCGVQLCREECPYVDCSESDPFVLDSEEQLGRIEVFNSLAVIAPQIELDRLRSDRRYNVTVDEYPTRLRHLRSEGILCMSSSKLALAFCILGMIFVVAVIVAIFCLIWGKSKSSRWTHGTNSMRANTSIFSSSSSSNSRFGGKLLIPYTGSLPYGRVY